MNFAIVLAAGIGSRFGKAVLKQRARVAGRVYEHTVQPLRERGTPASGASFGDYRETPTINPIIV